MQPLSPSSEPSTTSKPAPSSAASSAHSSCPSSMNEQSSPPEISTFAESGGDDGDGATGGSGAAGGALGAQSGASPGVGVASEYAPLLPPHSSHTVSVGASVSNVCWITKAPLASLIWISSLRLKRRASMYGHPSDVPEYQRTR